VSYDEFVLAYHSDDWLAVPLHNTMKITHKSLFPLSAALVTQYKLVCGVLNWHHLQVRLVNRARHVLIAAFSDQNDLYKRQVLELTEQVQVT
jgi:hypothetical protein